MKPIPAESLGCATDPSDENVKRWEAMGERLLVDVTYFARSRSVQGG